LIPKELYFVDRRRENTQCRMTDGGSEGGDPSQGRRQYKMSGGTKRKNLKPMVIISVVCGLRNATYFFLPRMPMVYSRYTFFISMWNFGLRLG